MAVGDRQEASSSSSTTSSRCSYHVFLSFKRNDIRKSFIDHLHTALVHAGIHTFIYDELERGENIKSELQKAIQQSRISIIVFSQNYASSRRCLDELVKILIQRRTSVGHKVLAIYYDVHPFQVREQTGSFAEAFSKHEEQFKAEETGEKMEKGWMEKMADWRAALREVADLEGMVLQNQADGYESNFIQDVVKNIRSKLNRMALNVARYPVGIDFRAKSINTWLQDQSTGVVIGVICGMGGIGKTTIAKAVYNLNFDRFDASSFLANIRQTSEEPNGLVRLQRQLLSDILKGGKEKIKNVHEGITKIKMTICRRRVLVILDDVNEVEQVDTIFGMRDWFYPGSKIIITTINERLLKNHEVFEIYKLNGLDDDKSLKLFSWHAFGQDHPIKDYLEHSKGVIRHCRGNPLALEILGSSLSGRSIEVWESALEKLEAIPDDRIHKKLEISYASLEDDYDKKLFLHIACFFVGKKKDYVVKILDECDYYTAVGIDNLVSRCLITIEKGNKLMMHQLIRDMGREIIRQESPEEPGKRSRLWHHKDSFYALKEKTGTERIEGLVLNMHMLEDKSASTVCNVIYAKRHLEDTLGKSLQPYEGNSLKRRRLGFLSWQPVATALRKLFPMPNKVDLNTDALSMMHKLSLLQLNYAKLSGGYEEFPKNLRWLCWHGFPLNYMPKDFPLESLVALDLRESSLEQVWKGTRYLRSLKFLNLSHSYALTRTPDFSGLPSLERLILKKCTSLVKVHESIGDLERLAFLNLRGCKNLRKLPRKLDQLKSLEKIILTGCSRLEWSITQLEKLGSLTVLNANRIAINQLCSTTGKDNSWPNLIWFRASKLCKKVNISLASLPRNLGKLSLAHCNISYDDIPKDLSFLPLLWSLDLSGNPISSLPESIKRLTMLKSLWLGACTRLESLPELPLSLIEFDVGDCKSLERMNILPQILNSLTLKIFDGCDKLVKVDGLFKLKPLGDFDGEMANDLGLVDLISVGNIEVELCNNMTHTIKKGPVQGLYEFGIFSTFLPGNEVPDWFSYRSMGSSISFTVPWLPNLKIRGLSVCVVYARSNNHKHGNLHDFYIKISNKSKGLDWTYGPTLYGNEDMMWLSHWKISDQVEGGDELNVSMFVNYGFQVKECGSKIVYEQEEKRSLSNCEKDVIQHNIYENVFDGDLSACQRSKGSYVLGHYDLYPDLRPPEQKPPSDRWDDPNAYDPSIWSPIYDTGACVLLTI